MCTRLAQTEQSKKHAPPRATVEKHIPRLTVSNRGQPDISFSKQKKGSQTTMERKMTERNFKFVP